MVWFCGVFTDIVVSLCHPGLSVDVGEPHLALLIELPVEADGILQVVLVGTVVEEPEKRHLHARFVVYFDPNSGKGLQGFFVAIV